MAAAQANCNAYFDGMKEIGKKHKHMFWIFSICYFFDMMDMNLFGSLGASVQATFALTNEQVSQLSSLSFYGMFFGGLLGGWMADKIGRKKALLYNVLIFSLASLGMAGAPLGDWISSKISDKGGRKTPITVMLFVATALCLVNGLTLTIFKGATIALAAYFVTNLFRAACATSATTMYWTYLAENLPNRYRSTGTGLIMSVSRLLIGVVTPTVPILFAMQGPVVGNGMFNVMGMNAIFYLIPAIICLLWGSKTAQKSLEEIEAEARK